MISGKRLNIMAQNMLHSGLDFNAPAAEHLAVARHTLLNLRGNILTVDLPKKSPSPLTAPFGSPTQRSAC